MASRHAYLVFSRPYFIYLVTVFISVTLGITTLKVAAQPLSEATPATHSTTVAAETRVGQAPMTVFIDPESGKPLPIDQRLPIHQSLDLSREHRRDTQVKTDPSGQPFEQTKLPGGGTMVDLRDRLSAWMVVTKSSNGLRTQCKVQHALQHPALQHPALNHPMLQLRRSN